MTPRQILAALAARWWWVVSIACLAVAGTAAVSVTMLKRYTATAMVMLDARTPDQVAGGLPSSVLPAGYLATQMDLISSERVGRVVIKALNLQDDSGWRKEWQKVNSGVGDYEAWLSESLVKNLSVRPAAMSNVVTVGYTDEDPTYAAQVANAYVKAYVDTSLGMRTERVKQFGTFFDTRAQELRAELERAQQKLSQYQQANGILVGDDRLNVESMRLAELSSQLLLAQTANAEATARMRQAGRGDQLPEISRSPAVAALESEVTREEVKLGELRARLGDSHPQLIAQEARLSELRTRLAAEKGRAASHVGFDNSATQSRVAQISAALEAQRARVLRMQAHKEQSSSLQRDVENAQRAYDAILQRVSQASFEGQNTHTNVTVLKSATAPVKPSSPNLLKNIVAGLAGGLILGMGLVLGREHLDRRLRTVDDVASLKQSMLISLPVAKHGRKSTPDTARASLMKQRVLTGLPRPETQKG